MQKAKVRCQIDGDVVVPLSAIVIDDAEGTYRFTCSACGRVFDKFMDEEIRTILRGAGVATLEELVASGSAALEDDESIWRALLKT